MNKKKPIMTFLVTKELFDEYARFLGGKGYLYILNFPHFIFGMGYITYLKDKMDEDFIDLTDCNLNDLLDKTSKVSERIYENRYRKFTDDDALRLTTIPIVS